MSRTKAEIEGRKDAQTWMDENDRSTWAEAIAPGQLDADEGLINALSGRQLAAVLGLDRVHDDDGSWTAAAREALSQYSRAWDAAVREALDAAGEVRT